MSENSRDQVTLILKGAAADQAVPDGLLPLVYDELRQIARAQMANESPGQTLQPTALVHEAYLRLVGGTNVGWDSRAHFFAAAARSMRQILINRANQKLTEKHGGKLARQDLNDQLVAGEMRPSRVLALDDALNRLEQIDDRKARIVMLRYFAGLSIQDTAKSMNLSVATVKREWQFSKAWLAREMNVNEE